MEVEDRAVPVKWILERIDKELSDVSNQEEITVVEWVEINRLLDRRFSVTKEHDDRNQQDT